MTSCPPPELWPPKNDMMCIIWCYGVDRSRLVTCGSDPKSGRASPVELPPSPLLSPSPLSGSRGHEMRVRGKGLNFYIWGELAAPLPGGRLPAAPPPGGRCLLPDRGAARSRQGPPRKKVYIYLYIGPCRPLPGGRSIKL